MKIIKLEFENINSLRGRHVIDFTKVPLSNSGLFLISGPTGSGKSTILDAITLALFNRIPRFSASISVNQIVKLGSVVTHFENSAMANIIYETNGVQYNSSWSLSKNRNDNWRDYHMEIYSVEDKSIFDLKKSEVPEQNEKLIGLKYEQFLKSILLSQGEFAQFLKSDANTRGALLEKLTGTEIYRKIGELAFLRFKKEKESIDASHQEINNISIIDAEILESKKKERKELTDHVIAKEEQLKIINQAIQTKTQLADIAQQTSKLTQNHNNHIRAIESFEPSKIRIQKHNALAPLTSEIALFTNRKLEVEKATREIIIIKQKLASATESLRMTLESMGSLVGKDITKDNFLAEMKALEQKYVELSTRTRSLEEDGKALRSKINAKLNDSSILTDKMKPDEAIAIIEQKESQFAIERKKINSDISLQDILEEKSEKISQIKIELSHLAEYHSMSANIAKTKTDISKLSEQADTLRIEIKTLNEKLIDKKLELDNKQIQLADHQTKMGLTELRNALKEHDPCPLCGSLDHPYRVHNQIFEEGKLNVELRIIKEEVDHIQQSVIHSSSALAANDSAIVEWQKSLENDNKKRQLIIDVFTNSQKDILSINVEKLKGEEVKCGIELSKIKSLIAEEKQLITHQSVKSDYLELGQILDRYKAVTQQLKSLYAGDDLIDITNNLQQQYQIATTDIASGDEALLRLENQIQEDIILLDSQEKYLLQKLLGIDVSSIEQAKSLILTSKEYDLLLSEQTKLEKIKVEIDANLNELRKRQLDLNEKDTDLRSLEELKQESNTIQNLRDEQQQSIGRIQEQLLRNAENQKLKDKMLLQIKDRQIDYDRWSALNGLIGDATGSKFANFAQDLTLRTLISITNRHLSSLSDRYQLVTTSITEDLAVYDTYQGDTIRAISTLSGGETFIVSLAMAVSLSELASRNVKIESIFIDEGFGSLDGESLEQAMSTLELLQSSNNKTIGIISHVDSLKERLTTQIQLTKSNKGFSTIQIVG